MENLEQIVAQFNINGEVAEIKPLGNGLTDQLSGFIREHPDTTLVIIDTLQTMPDVLCWVCTKNQSYTLESLPEHYYQMFLPYFPHVKKVQNFSLIKEPIVKFALYLPQQNTTQRIHDLTQIASQDIRIVDSGHACIDIIPRFVSKGMAIQLLMKEFHILSGMPILS